MDQGPGGPAVELGDSPSDLRAAIARTRGDLTRHLAALRHRLLHPHQIEHSGAETAMPTKKASGSRTASARAKASKSSPAEKKSSKSEKPGAKAGRSKASASKKKTTTRKARTKGAVARTEEVLDTMLAGAVVGAVTGAAQGVANEPTAVPPTAELQPGRSSSKKKAPTTKKVLGEMAAGAAVGAAVGAAKSVLPRGEEKTSKK